MKDSAEALGRLNGRFGEPEEKVFSPESGSATAKDCIYAIPRLSGQFTLLKELCFALAYLQHVNPAESGVEPKSNVLFDIPLGEMLHMTIAYGANIVKAGEKEVVKRDELLALYPEVKEAAGVIGSTLEIKCIRFFPNELSDVIIVVVEPCEEVVRLKKKIFEARPHLVEQLRQAHNRRIEVGDGDDKSLSAVDHPDAWHITLGYVKRGYGPAAVNFLSNVSGIPFSDFRAKEVEAISCPSELVKEVKSVFQLLEFEAGGATPITIEALAVCTAVSDSVVFLDLESTGKAEETKVEEETKVVEETKVSTQDPFDHEAKVVEEVEHVEDAEEDGQGNAKRAKTD